MTEARVEDDGPTCTCPTPFTGVAGAHWTSRIAIPLPGPPSHHGSMDSHGAYPPHALGAWGERQAAQALRRRGWRILARGYRLGRREVDIVAQRGGVLAFVEVKTRAGVRYGEPEEAVTRLKRREIETVARDFLLRHPSDGLDVRFDVIGIVVGEGRRIERFTHVADAWRPGAEA